MNITCIQSGGGVVVLPPAESLSAIVRSGVRIRRLAGIRLDAEAKVSTPSILRRLVTDKQCLTDIKGKFDK